VNFKLVQRASKACGLVKWVLAQVCFSEIFLTQVHFSEILDKVEPLQYEVQSLEQQAEQTKQQATMIIAMISELESSNQKYKEETQSLSARPKPSSPRWNRCKARSTIA
jgi:dynein heavy chain 1